MIQTIVSFGITLIAIGFAVFACIVEPGTMSGTLLGLALASTLLVLIRTQKLAKKRIAIGLAAMLVAFAAFALWDGAYASALAASVYLVASSQLVDWRMRKNAEPASNLEST